MSQFHLNESKRTDGKFIFFITLLFICIGLSGQTQQQQPQTVTITLSVQDAETVLKGLGKLPYDEAAPIVNSIISQAQRQLIPPQAPAKPDTTGKKKEEPKSKKN